MSAPQPVAEPRVMPADASALAMTQENLIALQKLAEQTAQLHRQFLEGQDRALQVFQALLGQQNQLMQAPAPAVRAIAPAVAKPTPPAPTVRTVARMAPPAPVEIAAAPIPAAPMPSGKLEATLLEVVAAKTGYPAEMLQLDMELDTDLGIDSIKRVEIFALLQEKLPDAPPVKAEHLGTLRTLRQVVDFLGAADSSVIASPAPSGTNADHATTVFLDVVSQKTGYPPEMLQLDMELDTDLGIDSIKRVEIFSLLQEKLPEAPTVKAEHLGTLRTIRQVIDFIAGAPSRNGTASPASMPKTVAPPLTPISSGANRQRGKDATVIERLVPCMVEWDEQTPREAVRLASDADIWIAADGGELAERVVRRLELLGCRAKLIAVHDMLTHAKPDRLAGLVMIAPEGEIVDRYLLDAFALLQRASGGLRKSGAVFATVTRLGGSFGLSGLSLEADSVTGGLAGLAKTVRHEWPEVHCKAIDLADGWDDLDEAAFAIVEEMRSAGPIEVGLSPRGRSQVQLMPAPFAESEQKPPLKRGEVVIITGGARGVTAETAVSLARAFAPTLVLLGRSAAPTPEPNWLAPLAQESEIKRALLTQLNGQATPKDVGERYQALAANREILATLARIEEAGAKAVYRQVDVRNAEAVRVAVAEIRREFGPIKGLVHGAGVLADRLIADKTAEQFETVYATKVASLTNLLDALKDDDLRVLALFSSSTARFGRTGQVDYAVANEVLNKLAQREAIVRPQCRVVSLNWGPWDGGMVNASLKKVFADEGVGVIPLHAGGEFFVQEICQAPGMPVEVVVMGGTTNDVHSKSAAATADTLAFERELSVESMPVLKSHVIKGHAVLPMALAIEWLAHGALHANPGLAFQGFNDLRVHKGIILPDDEPLHLRVFTGKPIKENKLYRVPVEIRGNASNGREIPHVRAEIILTAKLPAPEGASVAIVTHAYPHGKDEIYAEHLFHGPDLQGIETVEGCSEAGIVATCASAPPPTAWVRQPLRSAWLADPLVLDCGFQMMILWTQEQCGAGSLPSGAGQYRQFARAFPKDGVRIVARVTSRSEHRALADLDFVSSAGKLVASMNDYECVIDASLNQAFRLNQARVNAGSSS